MIPRNCCALAVLTVLAVTSQSMAETPTFEQVDPTGKPNGYKTGLSARYAIWHEGGTWHFRTTTNNDDSKVFSGTLEVIGGKMANLIPIKPEGKKAKKNLDYASWNAASTILKFSFTTGKGQDGFDLQLSDKATALKFSLMVDGKEVTKQIFLGSKNSHPSSATFTLPAHPGK